MELEVVSMLVVAIFILLTIRNRPREDCRRLADLATRGRPTLKDI